MISIGENKSILCKGDFHPAQLYKGDKKIAGYTVEEFERSGSVTLENCYNDNLYNAVIHGRSTRTGTPTLENPIELQSVGEKVTEGEKKGKYKVSITASGENGQSQTFDIYLDAPLRKIGNFKDYIDFEKGKVVRSVGKTVYTGNENWETHTSNNLLHYTAGVKTLSDAGSTDIVRSTHLSAYTWNNLYQNFSRENGSLKVGIACTYNESAKLRYIYVCPHKTATTVSEWKALLQQWNAEGNPFTVWYAIPTAECAIELPKIPTFKGTTIYEINTSISTEFGGRYKKQEVK